MPCDVRTPDVEDLFDDPAEVIEEVQRLDPGKASDFCFAKGPVSKHVSLNDQRNLLPRLPNHDHLMVEVST
jgi:hypothetical protein